MLSVLIIGTCSTVDLVSQYWKLFQYVVLKKAQRDTAQCVSFSSRAEILLQVVEEGVRNLIRICENVSSTAFLAMKGLDIGHCILLDLRI